QLGVFTDGSGLDGITMQNIAREMNYSETTFLLPPESGGDYRIRIFTPASQLPFAGHPLVGSAFVIVSEGMKQKTEPLTAVTLEAGVGPIHIEVQTEGGRPGRTTMTQPLPQVRGQYTNVEAVAKGLSLEVSRIQQTGLPIETIFNGIPVLVVPVESRADVESIRLDSSALTQVSREAGARTVLVFSRETM